MKVACAYVEFLKFRIRNLNIYATLPKLNTIFFGHKFFRAIKLLETFKF